MSYDSVACLGVGYPLDMWSIGCVVYELFTGRILFNGRTNNEMLKYGLLIRQTIPPARDGDSHSSLAIADRPACRCAVGVHPLYFTSILT